MKEALKSFALHAGIILVVLAMFFGFGAIVMQSVTAQNATDGYWLFNRNAPVAKPEFLHRVENNHHYTADVFRILDWQTGKVIYISVAYGDGVSVAVADIQNRDNSKRK